MPSNNPQDQSNRTLTVEFLFDTERERDIIFKSISENGFLALDSEIGLVSVGNACYREGDINILTSGNSVIHKIGLTKEAQEKLDVTATSQKPVAPQTQPSPYSDEGNALQPLKHPRIVVADDNGAWYNISLRELAIRLRLFEKQEKGAQSIED